MKEDTTGFPLCYLMMDDNGIFVWVFLGFCAMIVLAQVVPAVLLLTGMVKGVASVVKEEMATSKN